jgi:NAD(P)-dependent dehydrogenase (short-subunit alcohol dehydrogenase family)
VPPRTVSGKKVLVTGAASGMGRATAVACAARGSRLFLTDISEDPLRSTVAEIRSRGGIVEWAEPCDVADHGAVAGMAEEIHAAHGSADLIMNVAGIAVWGTVDRLEHEQWRRVVDVDLMGPIHVIECFVPAMIEAGRGGHVVNVSSSAGIFGLPLHAPYSAAKFGLRGLSEVLRFDLRRHDIGVTLVCPGAVDTGLVETVEIAGVDRSSPTARRLTDLFLRHAKTPEHAAARILEGIERDRFWVYTSRDIQLGHFLQRRFEFLYAGVMQRANDYFQRAIENARAGPS